MGLQLAGLGRRHARGQILHDRQGLDPLVGVSQLGAVQFGLDGELSLAIQALDLGRAGLEADVGHGVQGGGGSGGGGHAQGLYPLQVGAGVGGHADADGDAPLADGQLGDIGVDVTHRGDPGDLGDGVHRNAETGGLGAARTHDQLRTNRRRRGVRVGDDVDGPHLFFQLQRRGGQGGWIVAGQDRLQPRRALEIEEGDAGVGDLAQGLTGLGLELVAGKGAMLVH